MMRKQAPQKLKDLPGWSEAFDAALRAKMRVRLGHEVHYVGPQALRSAGNFVPPPSITRVTLALLLCLAIGVEHQRAREGSERRRAKEEAANGNLIDFARERVRRQCDKHFDGYNVDDPATWHKRPGTPYWLEMATKASTEGDFDDAG